MLKLFRDNLKSLSWVLWAVILVFVALVFVDGGAMIGPAAGGSAKAAWAGDAVVTFTEYQNSFRRKEDQYRQAFQGNLPAAFRDRLKIQTLEEELNGKLLLQQARRLGLTVPDEDLQKEILDFPNFQNEEGLFVGQEEYVRRTRRFGFSSPKDFEAAVREDLLSRRLDEVLRESAYVSDTEVEDAYREQVEKAKIRYLMLPSQSLVGEVEINEEDLLAYHEAHKEEYRLPEQRKIAYLLVDNGLLRSKIELSEEDLQGYYDAHSSDYQQEEQVRARHILLKTDERTPEEAEALLATYRQRIEGGEAFDEMAKELSEDPGSARNGGDLRFFGRGRMVPEFEQAAFGAEIGDLVGPVRSSFGVHLIEVTGKRDEGQRPLEEVQAQVRHKLLSERVEEKGKTSAAEVLARLKEEDASTSAEEKLRLLAEELDYVSFAVTPSFGRQDLIPGVGRSADFSSSAFDLEMEEISEPAKVPRGWALLVLNEEVEPRVPEMTEVEATVRQALTTEKQAGLARQRLEEAREAAEGGESLETLAEGLNLQVKDSQELGLNGSISELGTASSKVVELALSLDEGEFGGPIDYPQGAVLIQVAERQRMDPEEFADQEDSTRRRLESQAYRQLQAAVLNQRRRDLNATYHPNIVESLEDQEAAP